MNRNKYYANVLMAPEPGESGGGDPAPTGDPSSAPPASEPPAPTGDPAPNDPPKAFHQTLPDDWRNQVVDSLGGEDDAVKEKQLAQLNRFSTYSDMSKSFFEAQSKIRSGQIETGLPENATEDQLKDYREANGIPESA